MRLWAAAGATNCLPRARVERSASAEPQLRQSGCAPASHGEAKAHHR